MVPVSDHRPPRRRAADPANDVNQTSDIAGTFRLQGVATCHGKSVVTWGWHDGVGGPLWAPMRGTPAERGADVTTTIAANPLTATDRCDRCGAQAYVRATMESGFDLLLCGHHFRENEARLREIAKAIHDETERLDEVPSTAALDER